MPPSDLESRQSPQAGGDGGDERESASTDEEKMGSEVGVAPIDEATPRVGAEPGEPELAAAPATRRPFDWRLALGCLPIAVGLVLIGFGVLRSVTGDDVTNLPAAIENINPTPDAVQVPSQSTVVVDLAEGYEGRLIIDDVEFETQRLEDLTANPEPGTQVNIPAGVVFEPGNDTLTFTPGADIAIDVFGQGNHTVKVEFWRVELGPDDARTYNWTFNVV